MKAGEEAGAGSGERFHALDALRAFALLLGVFFHAAESFEPGVQGWAIRDVSPSGFLGAVRHASHSFRMELFFLIAGFFARLLVVRRGVGSFVRNRAIRILVPLMVGWLVLYPIMASLWFWGAQTSGDWSALQLPVEARGLPPWKVGIGLLMTGGFVGNFNLLHLWFLHQLAVIYILFLSARAIGLRISPDGGRLLRTADRWMDRWTGAWWMIPAAALATFPVLMMMAGWVDTPNRSLIPHAGTTMLYGGFFGVGWMLHRQPRLLERFSHRLWWPLLGALGLAVVTGNIFRWGRELGLLPQHGLAVGIVARLAYALMMWSLVVGVTGAFLRFCHQPSPAWRYVADASYWVYLAHLPIVVSLQVQLGLKEWPWVVKYPLILSISLPLLFATYHLLVRSTALGALLNGRRYPFRRPAPAA